MNGEEEPDTGVTYFVDEEGHYYYQPSGDNQNIVSLPGGLPDDAEVSFIAEANIIIIVC